MVIKKPQGILLPCGLITSIMLDSLNNTFIILKSFKIKKMSNLSAGSYFPILVDLTKFEIVVIGAGNISKRKIENLLEFNCHITVIAPEINDEILALNNYKIKLIQRSYQKGDIPENGLVFCATSKPDIDALIKQECDEKNVLLNVADVPELCNFIMPATIKRGDLTISIASQGKAPFYVREIRKRLSKIFTNETAEVVELAHFLREEMIKSGIYYDSEKREKIIEAFLKMNLEKILRDEGMEFVTKKLNKLIEDFSH